MTRMKPALLLLCALTLGLSPAAQGSELVKLGKLIVTGKRPSPGAADTKPGAAAGAGAGASTQGVPTGSAATNPGGTGNAGGAGSLMERWLPRWDTSDRNGTGNGSGVGRLLTSTATAVVVAETAAPAANASANTATSTAANIASTTASTTASVDAAAADLNDRQGGQGGQTSASVAGPATEPGKATVEPRGG